VQVAAFPCDIIRSHDNALKSFCEFLTFVTISEMEKKRKAMKYHGTVNKPSSEQ